MDNNWKKHLLKSGLPFEYEVKECFVKCGCTVWDEYSYLKRDENNIEKEFSYDLDANAWNGGHSIDFMIECKYKTEPTKWFFTPDPYSYQQELNQNSFFHPVDHFTKNTFPFNRVPFDKVINEPLGPFCLKGVEIFYKQPIEINISRAIKQLSYAFIDKIISAFSSQLDEEIKMFNDSVFLQIPLIITNADLHLINENITTKEIKKANSIEEISTEHDFLIFHNKIGEHLRNYNLKKLAEFFSGLRKKVVDERINTFTKDLNHFVDVIASNYSPECILIMKHDENHNNYKKLFDYINFLTQKSSELDDRIHIVQEEMKRMHKGIAEKFRQKKNAQKP
jgi:hypothetical protein